MIHRINLLGGPGVGKSVVAATLFAKLKIEGYNVELVNEWVKTWAWQKITPTNYDQLYVFAKQLHKEDIVLRSGATVITDSPVITPVLYALYYQAPFPITPLLEIAIAFEKQYPSCNILLQRTTRYKQEGRYQNEEEAKQIDQILHTLLNNCQYHYHTHNPLDTQAILDRVHTYLESN